MLKVECESCKAPFQIDERRVPPSGLKMRCSKCGHSFLVRDDGAPAPEAPGAAPERPSARPASGALAPGLAGSGAPAHEPEPPTDDGRGRDQRRLRAARIRDPVRDARAGLSRCATARPPAAGGPGGRLGDPGGAAPSPAARGVGAPGASSGGFGARGASSPAGSFGRKTMVGVAPGPASPPAGSGLGSSPRCGPRSPPRVGVRSPAAGFGAPLAVAPGRAGLRARRRRVRLLVPRRARVSARRREGGPPPVSPFKATVPVLSSLKALAPGTAAKPGPTPRVTSGALAPTSPLSP